MSLLLLSRLWPVIIRHFILVCIYHIIIMFDFALNYRTCQNMIPGSSAATARAVARTKRDTVLADTETNLHGKPIAINPTDDHSHDRDYSATQHIQVDTAMSDSTATQSQANNRDIGREARSDRQHDGKKRSASERSRDNVDDVDRDRETNKSSKHVHSRCRSPALESTSLRRVERPRLLWVSAGIYVRIINESISTT